MNLPRPDDFYMGKPVRIIHRGYYTQKKNSKSTILNFIYRILFGTEFIYEIETGKVIEFGNCLLMNPITFQQVKELIEKEEKDE